MLPADVDSLIDLTPTPTVATAKAAVIVVTIGTFWDDWNRKVIPVLKCQGEPAFNNTPVLYRNADDVVSAINARRASIDPTLPPLKLMK